MIIWGRWFPKTTPFSPMIIICWNFQGLGNSLTIQASKDMYVLNKLHIVSLLETKARKKAIRSLIRKIEMDAYDFVEPFGLSNNICLIWKEEVQIQSIITSRYTINIVCGRPNASVRITFIYGCQELKRHNSIVGLHYCL